MQEEKLDGSYLITQRASEEEIINAINNEFNKSVTVANSAADLTALQNYNNGSSDFSWLSKEPDQFYVKQVKGKWKKFKKR
jgi:hypothetical protein